MRSSATEPSTTAEPTPTEVRLRRAGRFRWSFVAVSIVIGLGLPWLMLAALPPEELGYAEIANPTQLLVSVFVPCIAVLLAYALKNSDGGYRDLRAVGVTMAKAVGISAGLGAVASAMAVVAGLVGGVSTAHLGFIAVAGVLLQAGAGLIGFGLGTLFSSPWVGCPSTVVLPLAVFFALDGVSPQFQWLAPFGAAQEMLAAAPDAWWHWLIMVIVWAGALNVSGIALVRRR